MSIEIVRDRVRSSAIQVLPEREWLACRLYVEVGRTFAAVIEVTGPLFLYVYSDPYTLAVGTALTPVTAIELMLPRGDKLMSKTLLESLAAAEADFLSEEA